MARLWLIFFACGLARLSSSAQVPDHGVIADQLPNTLSPVTDLPKPHTATTPISLPLPMSNRGDGEISDSIGIVSARPVKDVAQATPDYFVHAENLRKHNDTIFAIEYLRQIVTNAHIPPRYRSRAILELSDCLEAEHQRAESLCWLKIWLQLYPARPEFGGVAFRIGTLYREMGLPDLARDAFYLTLAHSVNQGSVQSADDLKEYTRLTEGTLWQLAANEYQSGQWTRAVELFQRYRQEATFASAHAQETAAFLQADCYYQLKQVDQAISLYEEILRDHPFNPLAPQGRLRLYHLYVLQHAPEKAEADLEALVWTVRTVWPKDETYWQRQTAQLLLAINQKSTVVLAPILQQSFRLPPEGRTWQDALDHYDALVSYETATTQSTMEKTDHSTRPAGHWHGLAEENDLIAMDSRMNQLLLLPRTGSNQ